MSSIDSLPDLPGLRRHGATVRRAFVSTLDSLGWHRDQADALAATIEHESGWRADARNPMSGASGLIQFMPATARHLGTSIEAIRAMDEVGQLEIVARFYRPFGRTIAPRDVPIAALLPAYVGRSDEATAFSQPSKAYEQNRGLDLDHDGRITLGEVRRDALEPLRAASARPRLPIDTGETPAHGGPLEPQPPPAAGPEGPGAGRASGGGGALLVCAALALVAWRCSQ